MGDLSEFELIERILARMPATSGNRRVRVGSGDDAAVVESGAAAVVSVDALIQDVHFTLPQFPLEAVGRKGLAAGLSDLAAMGAVAGEAYIILGVPRELDPEALLGVADGVAEVARREEVTVVGGDVSRAPALLLAVTAIGYEPPDGALLTRAGAVVGDLLVVTGRLGGAAAALRLLRDGGSAIPTRGDPDRERLLAGQLDPQPRLAAGRALAASGARAMIDVSDGLGADAAHLARAGGVRLEIELERLPVDDAAISIAGSSDARGLAASGGEDYELLASLPPERLSEAREAVAAAGCELTDIGAVREGEGVSLRDPAGRELEPKGFDHLRD
jgi:thiamine-monophosphate kinase